MKACCLGVVQKEEGLLGAFEDIKGVRSYVVKPKGEANGICAIVVADIYGTTIPNPRHVADFMASKGFVAIMPDILEEDTWAEVRPLNTPDFGQWWNKWTEQFPIVLDKVKTISQYARETLNLKVGALGFCWGGRQVDLIARHPGVIDAGVTLHGGMMDGPSAAEATVPLKFIVSGDDYEAHNDAYKRTVAAIEAHPEKRHEIVVYEGFTHGFAVRGDYSKPEIADAQFRALNETAEFLSSRI